ncbi:MAG: CHASE2 domain-containing protein [Lentisphaeraceae bacterium]|nr:CHASE2 domain-containing protein [Lentisphaeraceae bacterium]
MYSFVYSEKTEGVNQNELRYYERVVSDSFIKARYKLKSKLDKVDVSNEITIIGIDDKSQEWFGKFGNTTWTSRLPYDANFRYLQKYFPPACLSLDIIFRSDLGSFQKEHATVGISSDPDKINEVAMRLNKYAEELDRLEPKTLLDVSGLVSEQGELLFAFALSSLQSPPPNSKLVQVPVVLAYDFQESETYYQENRDFDDINNYKWSFKEVFGDLPEEPDEELGTVIPYLLTHSFPLGNVKNLPEDYPYLPRANLVSENFTDLSQLGFINARRDQDGIVRRLPLVLASKYFSKQSNKLESFFVPSLSLLTVMNYLKVDFKDVTVVFGQWVHLKNKAVDKKIPIDSYGRLRLNFEGGAHNYNYVSFKDINEYGMALSTKSESSFDGPFKQKLDSLKESLTGNICLVGLTATGNSDTGPTALETNTSYVYAHATAINSILKSSYLQQVSTFETFLMLFSICLLMSFLGNKLLMRHLAGFSILLFFVILGVCFTSVYYSYGDFPVLYICIYLSLSFIGASLVRFFTQDKERAKIRKMFSTMVSSSVLEYMDENPDKFSLSGQRLNSTIMFSDVAGFTSISEGLSPEKLVQLLNEYLTPMTQIVMKYDGYVDKYEGDAIMADWGVPYPSEDHAMKACYACLDQQEKLDEIRSELYEKFGYELHVRMGINTGDVSAGNMGAESHFSYTVMGDAVNLAARLEPTNKVYGTTIMIGENTYEQAKDFIEVRFLDKVVVVGKKESIKVYELIGKKGEISKDKLSFIAHYEKGLALHEERFWQKAIDEFEAALQIEPEDTASKVMIERVKQYTENPPDASWQGEYIRKSKD